MQNLNIISEKLKIGIQGPKMRKSVPYSAVFLQSTRCRNLGCYVISNRSSVTVGAPTTPISES